MERAYPPFEMTDEKGEPTGVSADMAIALGEFLDRLVEIRNMSFDGLIPALKSGSIDLIISSMTATEAVLSSFQRESWAIGINQNTPEMKEPSSWSS